GASVQRPAGVGADLLQRLLAAGEVHHGGDADAGALERAPRLGDEARPEADGGDRAVQGGGAAAEVGGRRGIAGVVEVGEVERGERAAGGGDGVHQRGPPRCAGAKAPGSSAPTVVRARSPSGPARTTGVSGGANSASFWRQPP